MKKLFLFSMLLFLLFGIDNRLSAQYEEFHHAFYGYVANTNARLVTHIREEGAGVVSLEALVIGYFQAGAIELSINYDADVVYPTYGPNGAEIDERVWSYNLMKGFLVLNPMLPVLPIWESNTSGDINPGSSTPYVDVSTGGTTMAIRIVQDGEIYQIYKMYFKIKPGQALSNTTFTYYERNPLLNQMSLGIFIRMSGTTTPVNIVRPEMLIRRIKSDVTTTDNFVVNGTSVIMKGVAEIVNRDVEKVDVDFVGQRGGLDWDTILTTGFIYSKSDVSLTIDEYTKILKINGSPYAFPDATEILAGFFVRNGITFYIVSTDNVARSYDISMLRTVNNLDPVTDYYAYAFLTYCFQTSDPYPVLGEQVHFKTTCDPTIPPSVTSPYMICATPTQYLSDIPVFGTNLKWYSDPEIQNLIADPSTTALQDETVYYVTQTINGCESAPSSVTVFFTSTLEAVEIASPQTFCNNTFHVDDIALPAGITVKWYDAETGGNEVPGNTLITSVTIYWAALVQGDCESETRIPVVVSVNTTPAGPAITTPQYFCAGAVISSINTAPYNPADILWYEDAAGLLPITDPATLLATGSYYAKLHVGGTCYTTLSEVEIEIGPDDIEFATDTYVSCQNVKLSDIPVSGWGIRWFSDPDLEPGHELDPTVPQPSGTYYSANSFGNCLIPNLAITIVVHDNVNPPEPNTTANHNICEGSLITKDFVLSLINTNDVDFDYKIYTNSTCTIEFTTPMTAVYGAAPHTHLFYARAFVKGLECGSPISSALVITVVVDPLPENPEVDLTADNTICEGLEIDATFLEGLLEPSSYTISFYTDEECEHPFTSVTADPQDSPYTFYALATNASTGCVTGVSNATPITVEVVSAPPTPTIDFTNGGALCTSANVMLFVTNQSAYTNPTYQWYRGTTKLTNATDPYYVTTTAGTFTVEVTAGGCTAVSAGRTVTPAGSSYTDMPPVITVTNIDNGGKLCTDANVMLYVSNIGDYGSAASFQWYKNGVPISGATNNFYITNVSGYYSVEVNITPCSMVSSGIQVTLETDPFGYVQPLLAATNNGALCTGGNVMLYLENGDIYEGATYKWYLNGSPITGATLPYLMAGAIGLYHVEVTIDDCSMMSTGKQVTTGGTFDGETPVLDATNDVLCDNATVMVYLTTVYENATYKWFHDGVLMSTEFDTYIVVDEAGTYHVEVTVNGCSKVSAGLSITPSSTDFGYAHPIIAIANGDVVCDNANAMLYVTNASIYPTGATYQWYKDGLPLADKNDTYIITDEEGTYHVEVTITPCSAMSNKKELEFTTTPFGYPIPAILASNDGTLCDDANVMLYLNNVDDYPATATYQWYRNGVQMSGKTDTYIIVEVAGSYFIEVKVTPCAAFSNVIPIRDPVEQFDFPAPALTTTSEDICEGTSVLLYLTNGDEFVGATYQWYKDGLPISATTPYYTTDEEGIYHVEVIIDPCSRVSNGVSVSINSGGFTYPKPEITATNGTTICVGSNNMLYISNIIAYNNSGATFQWFLDGLLIPDATDNFYVATVEGVYHVVVMIDPCSSTSDTYTLTEGDPFDDAVPVIAATNDGVVCNGANVMLYITNDDDYEDVDDIAYQWFFNGSLISGANDAYYITDEPGFYHLEMTIGDCSAVSNVIEVEPSTHTFTDPRPEIEATYNGVLCDMRSVTLSVSNEEDYTNPSYQWFYNGALIPDADEVAYETLLPGDYHVEVIVGDCSMVSEIYQVTYKPKCGSTVLGTVFPFVKYDDPEDQWLNSAFVINVSLKAIPAVPENFDAFEFYEETPIHGPVEATYYDGQTFVPGTPKTPGFLYLLNNYGKPIDFLHAIGVPQGTSDSEILLAGQEPENNANMTVGLYRFDEVEAGDYIVEIKRDGYLVRWFKITVDDNLTYNYVDHREIIPGDIDENFQITVTDVNELRANIDAHYTHTPDNYWEIAKYDLNADGTVNVYDLNLLIIYMATRYYHYVDTREWLDELHIDY